MATDRLINSTQGDSIISELDNIADKIEGINRDIILPSNQINAMTGYSEPSGTSAITPSKLSRSIAPKETGNISFSFLICFEAVPEETSAWKPETAPQAIVTNKYGKRD